MKILHTSDWHLGHSLKGFDRHFEHQCFLVRRRILSAVVGPGFGASLVILELGARRVTVHRRKLRQSGCRNAARGDGCAGQFASHGAQGRGDFACSGDDRADRHPD